MDVEDRFDVNFENDDKSRSRNQLKFGGFDIELVRKAESLSAKWELLFKRPTQDQDVADISRIIETVGLSSDHVGAFTHQNRKKDITSNPESIAEKDNLILLDRKYFQFESCGDDVSNKAEECSSVASTSEFDFFVDKTGENPTINDETTSQKMLKKKKKKRNGRRKQIPTTEHETHIPENQSQIKDIAENLVGAPPGAKIYNSQSLRRGIDLTKNSNYSLSFRL